MKAFHDAVNSEAIQEQLYSYWDGIALCIHLRSPIYFMDLKSVIILKKN